MGVYINMEMPKNCKECPFYWEQCGVDPEAVEESYRTEDERHPDCPLIHVPPHGDLIDRDAAKEIIKPWSPEDERSACTFDTVKKLMHTMLDRTPVIIPAEEEEICTKDL